MEIITMILSGLALLAASVSLILTVQEKKRNEKRNAAVLHYMDETAKKIVTELDTQHTAAINGLQGKIYGEFKRIEARVVNLEKGIVPDFEEAKAAAKSVDEFNRGLNAILGFDPFAALEKQRNQVQEGE